MNEKSLLPFPLGRRWINQQENLRLCSYEYLQKKLSPGPRRDEVSKQNYLDMELLFRIYKETNEISEELNEDKISMDEWHLKDLELRHQYGSNNCSYCFHFSIIYEWTQLLHWHCNYFTADLHEPKIFPITLEQYAYKLWNLTSLLNTAMYQTLLLFPPKGAHIFNILPKKYSNEIFAEFFNENLRTTKKFKDWMEWFFIFAPKITEVLEQGSDFINKLVIKNYGAKIEWAALRNKI